MRVCFFKLNASLVLLHIKSHFIFKCRSILLRTYLREVVLLFHVRVMSPDAWYFEVSLLFGIHFIFPSSVAQNSPAEIAVHEYVKEH